MYMLEMVGRQANYYFLYYISIMAYIFSVCSYKLTENCSYWITGMCNGMTKGGMNTDQHILIYLAYCTWTVKFIILTVYTIIILNYSLTLFSLSGSSVFSHVNYYRSIPASCVSLEVLHGELVNGHLIPIL